MAFWGLFGAWVGNGRGRGRRIEGGGFLLLLGGVCFAVKFTIFPAARKV